MGSRRESTMICPQHEIPLNFWSDKESIYKCIKCLINEKEVHFVDHSYKSQFQRFKEIKAMTEMCVEDNKFIPTMIHDWKEDIRDVLLRVRHQMIEFIENFTERFIKQIGKIESDRRELTTFVGEDRRQGERLSYIETKLVRINAILKTVEDT